MTQIFPVILIGGSGDRLWPLSRENFPKQFHNLNGDTSLFQQSIERFSKSNIIDFEKPICITHKDLKYIAREQLSKISVDAYKIIVEPQIRNTAPAVIAAALCWQYFSGCNSFGFTIRSCYKNSEKFCNAVKKGILIWMMVRSNIRNKALAS